MKFQLLALTLINFKGIRHQHIDFEDQTNLWGKNGSGKTTVVDGFLWLFIDKNSNDSSDFNIKTLDANNEPYHHLSHEVNSRFLVDGLDTTAKKIYKEKWTKKKGTSTAVHDGHTTEYYWNDVPCSEKEFNVKVTGIVSEGQFRMLTFIRYFNEVLNWKDRRASLIKLAGGIDDMEVAERLNVNGKYNHLLTALKAKKSIDEYKKEIGAKVKKIKDDSFALPDRIDEAKRGLPDEMDFNAVEKEISQIAAEIKTIESQLLDQTEAQKMRQQKINGWIKEQATARNNITTLENDVRNTVRDQKQHRFNKLADIKRELRTIADERSSLASLYNQKVREQEKLTSELGRIKQSKDNLIKEWDTVDATTFTMDSSKCECPACKRPLDNAFEIEGELKANFNKDKADRLARITSYGKVNNQSIIETESSIELLDKELSNIKHQGEDRLAAAEFKQKELAVLEEEDQRLSRDEEIEVIRAIEAHPEIIQSKKLIAHLDAEINAPEDVSDTSSLKDARKLKAEQISQLNRTLSTKDQRERILTRIAELEKTESESAQALADLELMLFTLQEFDKAKMDMLEAKINGRFHLVKFKLFDRQINGGESPTCVALIDGVPYTDANTAAKVNANLDIINVFSNQYNVQLPLFIDNRESVTDLIDHDLQIINLHVDPHEKVLRVGSKRMSEAPAATLFN